MGATGLLLGLPGPQARRDRRRPVSVSARGGEVEAGRRGEEVVEDEEEVVVEKHVLPRNFCTTPPGQAFFNGRTEGYREFILQRKLQQNSTIC